jgi:hypothetical protein
MRHTKLLRTFHSVWVGVTIALAVLLTVPIVGLHAVRSSNATPKGTANRRLNAAQGIPSGRADGSTSAAPNRMGVRQAYGQLPLYFEANQGQTDRRVTFLSRGSNHTLFLTPTEAVLVLSKARPADAGPAQKLKDTPEKSHSATQAILRSKFVGANSRPRINGRAELPGKTNYFIGNDPTKWRTNVPTYAKVEYENLYPGIDLVYYGNQRQLEYDFIVRPGADPKKIVLELRGADKLDIDPYGDLVLNTAVGAIHQRKPLIYQEVDGVRREIPGSYVLTGTRQVGFQVAAYDSTRLLIIDPVLFYSTYLGGSANDSGHGIAVDGAGNAYVAGATNSSNFPTTGGAFQTALHGVENAFVTKLNPTGSALVYSTYFGGSGDGTNPLSIAVDSSGNAYVTGITFDADFPTTPGAFQTTFGGSGTCCGSASGDAFVTKLNPTGSGLVYSTYLGGNRGDNGNGIAVDGAGNAYVAGQTSSTNFPTTAGAFQTTFSGGTWDAFVTKLNPLGSGLVYSTYLGGGGDDLGFSIALDSAGNAYVTGETSSTNFPVTPGVFQTSLAGGFDAFVTKLNPLGSGLAYSTYFGGSGNDLGRGIALDGAGNAYVTGYISSTNFPTTAGAFQTMFGGGALDAFVTKLNPLGTGLLYSTYLGGSGDDFGQGVAVDTSGNVYVTGFTGSTNFPTANPVQATFGGGTFDAFVTAVNPLGTGLVYSTYLGGSDTDFGFSVALDSLLNPNVYVTGQTGSTNFPITTGAFQTVLGGGTDAFVTKITNVTLEACPPSGKGECEQEEGEGEVDDNTSGDHEAFGFIVRRPSTTGNITGDLQFVNRTTGTTVHSVTLTSLASVGNTATFGGICTVNSVPCTFVVNLTGNGAFGTDAFTISISGGPPAGGLVRSGSIQILRTR